MGVEKEIPVTAAKDLQSGAGEVIERPAVLPGNTAIPGWFVRTIALRPEEHSLEVEGCHIHFLCWGQRGKPGLLFVHGGFAHAHWWDFIGPLFADCYRVAALDLSGMGDSGHRARYTGDLFAKEVLSVAAQAQFGKQPIIIGHSFGGYVALKAGASAVNKLTGIVVVDFPIRPPELQKEYEARRPLVKPKEVYPTLEAALERFRLIPAQPCKNAFILEHIARHSVGKITGGWSWKFDDRVFNQFELGNVARSLPGSACKLSVIYGEKSALFSPAIIKYMTELLGPQRPLIMLRRLHHHLFLESPFGFIKALNILFKQWEH